MTYLAFGRGSRLMCAKCCAETYHSSRGRCCHCDTVYVTATATAPPEFNARRKLQAHDLRPSGGRPQITRPDRATLRAAVETAGSNAAAGKRLGVSETTVHRWLLSYGMTASVQRKSKIKDVPRETQELTT